MTTGNKSQKTKLHVRRDYYGYRHAYRRWRYVILADCSETRGSALLALQK